MSLVSHCAAGAWDLAMVSLTTSDASALSVTTGPSSWTALHFAAAARTAPSTLLHALLDAGAAIDARASSGSTPLHLAAWHGCPHHITLLLSRGALLAATTCARRAPLHFAARRGHTDIVQLLVDACADVNLADAKGMTALHFAVDGAHEAAVHTLIDAGAACLAANDGCTPLDVARRSGTTEILDALRDAYGEHGGNSELGVDSMSLHTLDVEDLPTCDSASKPWLGGRLASVLCSKADSLARQVLSPRLPLEDASLADELSALSPDELAQVISAYGVKGQAPVVAAEHGMVIARAVRKYHLTAELLLAAHPTAETLVHELLAAGGVDTEAASRGALFHILVNFINAARAARSGAVVQTALQFGFRPVTRKAIFTAIVVGVLFSLLIPMARRR